MKKKLNVPMRVPGLKTFKLEAKCSCHGCFYTGKNTLTMYSKQKLHLRLATGKFDGLVPLPKVQITCNSIFWSSSLGGQVWFKYIFTMRQCSCPGALLPIGKHVYVVFF